MSFLVYGVEDNGREQLVVETDSYASAVEITENSKGFFKNGYKIYEKKLFAFS